MKALSKDSKKFSSCGNGPEYVDLSDEDDFKHNNEFSTIFNNMDYDVSLSIETITILIKTTYGGKGIDSYNSERNRCGHDK